MGVVAFAQITSMAVLAMVAETYGEGVLDPRLYADHDYEVYFGVRRRPMGILTPCRP